MSSSKNSFSVSAPMEFTYTYASSDQVDGDAPSVFPNMGNPISHTTEPNMGLRMFNMENVTQSSPMIESPMVNIKNDVSYGAILPNMNPMFDIKNGVPYGGVILPNMDTSMFDIKNGVPGNGVALPSMANGGGIPFVNIGTSMSSIANGVPYSGFTFLKTQPFHMANNALYGLSFANASSNNGPSTFANASSTGYSAKKGRPLGSKNRPKGENSAPSSVILTVPEGTDLVEWVVAFAKTKKVCITVQGGSVAVSEAHLSFSGPPAPPEIYKEDLTLLTFSGAYMYSTSQHVKTTYFNASLSRADGVIIGGAATKIITQAEVLLSANLFKNPELWTVKTDSMSP